MIDGGISDICNLHVGLCVVRLLGIFTRINPGGDSGKSQNGMLSADIEDAHQTLEAVVMSG